MGGGPRNPKDAPADCLATDSVIHHTSEVPVVTEDDAATVTGREQDSSNAVAEEVQTVKANNQDPPHDSQEQRIAKLKGIYAGLVMVESECIEVDANQMPPTDGSLDITKHLLMIPKPKTELPCYVEFRQLGDQSLYKKIGSEYWVLIDSQWVPSLNAEQFAALIELHGTLLHKHYDFLLESQHPRASAALKRLVAKYDMPARMWWHGIHSFLEVMRKRLVESGEHMACFIILAYKMMSLLEETVPRFRHTWIQCKADLARYGFAAAVQTAKEPAAQTVDESVEGSLVEVKREENENEDVQQQDSQAKEVEAEKTQEEDEQKDREAQEAEVRRREGLHLDPPLFPNGWLKRSKYGYNDIQVRNYVQDAATCDARSNQLLHLAAELTDEERRYWISVPGASSVPKPDPNKKMPEIIERDGGVRVVYVHPLFHAAEIEREKRRAAREEKWQKEKKRKEEERQKEKKRKEDEAKATTDVATIAVNEKVEGDAEDVSVANNGPEASQLTDTTEQQPTQSEKPVSQVDAEKATEAVNLPAVAPSTVSEDGDHEPSSAYEMDLDKAIGLEKIF
ncbi:unnamed protein product [Fusarium fujikuroi]|nr:unnamed protein product [Fusarium fujikuroi]